MSVGLYMDVHVPRAITDGLRLRRVDVLTAHADAVRRQRVGLSFAGVIYAHQLHVTLGQCIADLELIANVGEPADLANASTTSLSADPPSSPGLAPTALGARAITSVDRYTRPSSQRARPGA